MNWDGYEEWKNAQKENIIVHDPGSDSKINQIFVFVSRDANGNEGILAHAIGGKAYPLVCGDPRLVEAMWSVAHEIKKLTVAKVYLLRFDQRKEVSEV